MLQKRIGFRALAALWSALFLVISVWLPAAQANMIGTDAVVGAAELEQTRGDVLEWLAEDTVREQLVAWGVDPEYAEQRVSALTAAELQTLSERMGEAPAGAGVSSVVSAALIVFLVLLITDIMGFTNVFPFVEQTAR
ncbi:PA2779 family protein [Aquisalimonas sp.]|uniref:PA2779 family protein n=1 Tax=Aquisalimonas sp. TaxID=1872621 RepID=UPI0025C05851|nr:PA2779 family protein [Aquisalimonas sp.]